jgi:hypothetical protein
MTNTGRQVHRLRDTKVFFYEGSALIRLQGERYDDYHRTDTDRGCRLL